MTMARAARHTMFLLLASAACIPAPGWAGPKEDIVAHGKYLATAGDCVACHSAPGGKPYAGGLYLDTPFGRMATPNITPDKKTGIGNWTDDQFFRALHAGIRNDGAYLYPGLPYQWFTHVTRDDVLAIKAYLFSLPAVDAPQKPNHLIFPFNVREGIAGWNAVYFKEGTFKPDPSKSPEWNRGAYLVTGLEHCAACHTPRNVAQAPIESEAFAGGSQQNYYAPNITSDPKEGIGSWSVDTLVEYFKKGAAPGRGVVIGPMAETVHDSLSKLTDADLHDIAVFVKTIPAKSSYKPSATTTVAYNENTGADIYLTNCASCHQPNGHGLGQAVPPLAGNGAVTAKGPENVINAVVGGLAAQDSYAPMPGFATSLTPEQIADVANYVRTSWGNGAPASATPELVTQLAAANKSMMAGTHWCVSVQDGKLGHVVSDPHGDVQTALQQITDNTELPQVDKVIADVRREVPGVQPADIVNQLTAAYCPIVFKNKAVPKDRWAPKLDEFAGLVYTQLKVTQ